MMKVLRDLFMGVGNTAWDLGRILGAAGLVGVIAAAVWNVTLGLPIELDKLGVALAAVLTAAAALVYAKDRAKTENVVAKAMDCPPAKPVARRK